MLEKNAESILDNIQIASPCRVDWDTMTGDEKTRFCHECKLNVHNLSAMTKQEAESLVKTKKDGERICIAFYRRADGTVLTQDCPVGIKYLRIKARRAWNKVASFVSLFMCFGLSVQAQTGKSDAQPSCAMKITVSDQSLKTGIEAYENGEHQKAFDFFKDSCAKNPRNDEARYYFGLSALALNKNSEALKQFKLLSVSALSKEIRAAAQDNMKTISAGIRTMPQRTMGMIAPVRPQKPAQTQQPQMIKGDYAEREIGKMAQ